MAVTADRVVVELEARLDRYEANVARAEAKFDKAMGGIQKNASATEALVSRAMGGITAALAGVSVIALSRAFLAVADEAKKLDAQLKLATAGFGSYGKAQEDVRRIADETRSGLSETASLYGNFSRGAKELGATQAEAARATETFSKTLKISGADANQAASATLQFGQALAAGALRGDELNSILEASPRLARLLAESLGKPIGEIKKLGEEGKLTSDVLLRALTDKRYTDGIDAEFKQLPVTFDQAMTKVYNAAIVTFGAFDEGGEFSTALANFITGGSEGFADLERSAQDFGVSVRGTLEGLGDAFDPFFDAGSAVIDALGLKFGGFAQNLRTEIAALLGRADDLLNIGPSIANFFGANGKYDSKLRENFLKGAERSDVQRRMALIMAGDPLRDAPPRAGGPRARPAPSSSGKKTGTPRSKLNPEAFAREEASLNDEILRLKQVEITSADEKAKSEIARAETAKQAAIKDVNADERYTAEQKKKIVALVETVAALETAKAIYERDVQTAKEALDVRLGDLRNQQDLLRAQTDLADTREQRRDLELRLLDLAYQQERAELEAVIASKDASDAQKKIALARLDALGQMQQAETAGVERQYEGPLARYRRNLDATSTQDQIESLVTQELDYVRDGIRNSITKRLGIKDPFLAGLLDMFIQDQIIKPLASSLSGSGGGGLGSLIGSIGSFFGLSGARANGGPVAPGGTYLVGERGPELLKMGGSPGVVVPNHALRGSSAPQSVTVYVQANDYFDARVGQISEGSAARVVRQAAPAIGAQAAKAAVEATPAYLRNQRRFGS